ncbi:MAG TPA: flagellar hook capping FlgD N-terminal domain-containing protein [Pirellulales bacterium]|jgi:flagellar basal-body rod modification protein FlgD|nr:flagellar hook capping FlgD N-terminal domain-containing protein [Pirellulales bacterium]
MATTAATGATGSTTTSASDADATNNALSSLDVNQFLKLMITQLQNQDPLNPTDNNQILQQLSSMQQISTSGKLGTTLDSVLLGQNIASASSLVGKTVTGLTDAGNTVNGIVTQVTITGGTPYLSIGQDQVQLKSVTQINGVSTATPTTIGAGS